MNTPTSRNVYATLSTALDPAAGSGHGGESAFQFEVRRQPTNYGPPVGVRVDPSDFFSFKDTYINTFVEFARGNACEFSWVTFLDAQFHVQAWKITGIGSGESVSADPRDVFAYALPLNSAWIVFNHNHPTLANVEPSDTDRRATAHAAAIGVTLGVQVFDHVVFGDNGTSYSFRQHNERAIPEGERIGRELGALLQHSLKL